MSESTTDEMADCVIAQLDRTVAASRDEWATEDKKMRDMALLAAQLMRHYRRLADAKE